MSSKGKRLLLVVILVVPILWGLFNFLTIPVAKTLPYYGNKTARAEGDTLYHQIEEFTFINQDGKVINNETVKGKISIVNFFFATCGGVCPRMNANLYYLANRFRESKEVVILSHTVNPEGDSIPALKAYKENRGWGEIENWHFLTGKKKAIYDMAEYSYLAVADGASKEAFIHSDKIALVDGDGRIRGIFEGLGGITEMKKIEDAIKALVIEMRGNEAKK